MSRIALASLALAACAAGPRPIENTRTVPARYTLDPVQLHGGEGMHSSSQSWTTVSGSLEIGGRRTTLQLTMTTSRSFIHCPKAWQDGTVNTMQACAPDDAKDTLVTASLALAGEARHEQGQVVIHVRDDKRAAALSCEEHGTTLACSFDDDRTLFGMVGDRPSRVTFHL